MAQYGPQLWLYATGDPAANQPAAVFGPGDQNTFASIYSDAGMTVPLPNPTTTDANGNLEFYAADGVYWIFVGPVGTGDSILINLGASGGQVLTVNGIGPDGNGDVYLAPSGLGITPELIGAQPLATIEGVGDLYVGDGAGSTDNLPVTNIAGYVLTSDPGEPLGMLWAPPVTGSGGAVESVNGEVGVVTLDAADVGALGITDNLADLDDVGQARDNLGLGTAATADTGTGPTNVVLGNDARLTDSRTPAAHAATHAAAGTDPVTLAQSQITNLTTDLSAIVSAINGKQDADADLTDIASLSPSNDDILQRKSGAWTNRSISQLKSDLGYTASDVGAVAVTASENVVYGTTTAGAPANREVSTIASSDTVAVRTDAQQIRALTVEDGDEDAAATDLTNRAYVAALVTSKALSFGIAPRASEFFQAAGVITVRTSKAATLNVMYLYPIPVLAATTLTGVAWETTSAVATSVVRLGVYGPSASNGVGDLIADFGVFTSDTLGVIAAGMSQAVPSGLLWLAFVPQVAVPNFRHGAGWNPYVGSTSFPNGTGTGWNNTYFQTGVSGALPASATISGSTDSPIVGVKFA